MRILGIDPGSETTGWGVIEGDGRRYGLVECGTVRASTAQRFPARLLRIADALEEIIQRHHPDACAIEDGFLATNVKVTLKLGQVRGVAMQMVKTLLSLASLPEPHDAADALAVAICHFHHACFAKRLLAGAKPAGPKLNRLNIRHQARGRLSR